MTRPRRIERRQERPPNHVCSAKGERMWTDDRLLADLTEEGSIPIEMFFLSAYDGLYESLVPGYWQARDAALVPMGWFVDDREWEQAARDLLLRLGVPRFMSIQDEESARRRKEQELFPDKFRS